MLPKSVDIAASKSADQQLPVCTSTASVQSQDGECSSRPCRAFRARGHGLPCVRRRVWLRRHGEKSHGLKRGRGGEGVFFRRTQQAEALMRCAKRGAVRHDSSCGGGCVAAAAKRTWRNDA
eukprot:6199440-Pleurochrysis_carterae.AAC.1